MEIADRRKICQLVAGILVSDDDFAVEEQGFLRRIFLRFGLPVEEAALVQPIDAGAASTTLRELPPEVQAKVVALLVEAAIADGVVDPRERAYLLVAAAALGIDADVMEQRIAARLERIAQQGPMSNP
ncbi:MAG: TerB family tellurite resistance protein [Deltaproteobacteria bacterium]|jgi:tellurite resistance protein|nr:TerB family tellurite resistance protein [Deltaproteobacteria bacterium]MBW2536333.1 TerB family tellurite resistance protein [Deltaproteobacteria bacterium]